MTPLRHTLRNRRPRGATRRSPFICSIGILAFGAMVASGANIIWDGGDAASNPGWLNPLNWSADVAPLAGDLLVFNGTAGLTNTNDFAAGTAFNGLTFTAGAGAFVLGGNAVNLSGNLVSSSAATETVNFDLALQLPTTTASVVPGGALALGGVISGATANLTKLGAGRLSLTNSLNSFGGTVAINGGTLSLETTGALNTSSPLVLGGGELALASTAVAARTQTMGALTFNAGRGTFTLVADPAQPLSLTLASVGRNTYATSLYRGTSLGSAPGVGAANIFFTTAPASSTTVAANNAFAALGSGTLGTTQAAVLRGALADPSATGNGVGFATYDPTVGVRLLDSATEQTTSYSSAVAGDNVLINLTGATSITGKQTNTLQVANNTAGALTLTNSGTALHPSHGLLFTGTSGITLTGGTLTFNSGANIGDMVILSTNTAGVTIATALANGGSVQRGYTFGGPGNITVNSVINAAGTGAIAVNGPGTVTFGTATQSPSSQGFTVNGGTMRLATGFAMASSRPWKVASGATIEMNGISVANVDYIDAINGAGGTINNASGTASTLTLTSGSTTTNTQNFSGVISGNINLTRNVAVAGTSVQLLSGNNTYTGATTITGGTIRLGTQNALPVTTPLAVNGGSATTAARLDFGGFNQTVASLAGTVTTSAASIVNDTAATASTLTINGSASTSYAGLLLDNSGTGGTMALAKAGPGTLTLTNANAYSGGTTITGGTLRANNTTGSATGSGPVAVNGAGILAGTGIVSGAATVGSGGKLVPGTTVGTLTLGSLTLATGALLDYEFGAGVNDRTVVSNTDGLVLQGGSFNLFQEGSTLAFSTPGTYSLLQFAGTLTGNPMTTLAVANPQIGRTYDFGLSGDFVTLTIGSTATVASWTSATGGSWCSGPNWSTNPTIPNTAGASATLGSSLAASGTVSLDGSKTVGTVTFDNTNSYTIAAGSGGTLLLDNGAGTASIIATTGSHTITAPVNLGSASTVVNVQRAADTLSLSGVIGTSASGALTKAGPGTLVLSAANTYSGGTSLNGGTIQIAHEQALGPGTVTFSGNSTLQTLTAALAPANNFVIADAVSATIDTQTVTLTIPGTISDTTGNGALVKQGAGTLILLANNTYGGATTIAAGTVQVGNGGATGALGAGSVTNNGTLAFNLSGTLTQAGAISGTGGVQQKGTGSTRLGAANTYSGDTLLSVGELVIENALALQNSTLDLQGGTFGFASLVSATFGNLKGTLNLALTNLSNAAVALTVGGNNQSTTFSGALSGGGSLTKIGTGTLSLLGANTYTGATNVNAGFLSVGAGGSIHGGAFNTASVNGARLIVDGGELIATATSTVNPGNTFSGFLLSSGSATFTTLGTNVSADNSLIRIDGGVFSAATVNLGRTNDYGTGTAPTSAQTTSGLYVTGGAANLGTLNIGTSNSSAGARLDGGTTSVSGRIIIGNTTNTRWSILDVNGGNLNVGGVGGIIIAGAGNNAERAILLLRSGITTTEMLSFGETNAVNSGEGRLTVNGGTLYLGSGGIVTNAANAFTTSILLTSGTLGAKADWATANAMNFNGAAFTVKTADAADSPHAIVLSGSLTGSAAVAKTGGGTLFLNGMANSFNGALAVNAGTLGGTGLVSAGTTTIAAGASVLGGDGVTATGALTLNVLNLSDSSLIKLTLGAGGEHSSLVSLNSAWTFDADQAFSFIDAGAAPGLYNDLIRGLPGDPNTTATWTILNAGFAGTFSYDGVGGVDLELTAVPEPHAVLLLVGSLGAMLGRRRARRVG